MRAGVQSSPSPTANGQCSECTHLMVGESNKWEVFGGGVGKSSKFFKHLSALAGFEGPNPGM